MILNDSKTLLLPTIQKLISMSKDFWHPKSKKVMTIEKQEFLTTTSQSYKKKLSRWKVQISLKFIDGVLLQLRFNYCIIIINIEATHPQGI